MRSNRTVPKLTGVGVAATALLALNLPAAHAAVPLTKIITDPFTNTTSQHNTAVEPDTFAFGNTIVSAAQVGRFTDGGGSDIGYATSTDGGATWTQGTLPGITSYNGGGGSFARVSDASVAYDAMHNVWLISCDPDHLLGDRAERGRQPLHRRRSHLRQPGHGGLRQHQLRQELDGLRQHRDQPVLRPLLHRVRRQRRR